MLRRANRLAWTIARRRPCQLCMWTVANFGHCYGDATFVAYTSSVLEQRWLDNVARWQHDVCAHTSNATMKQLLDAVQGDVSSVVTRNATMLHDTLSYFTYALREGQFLHVPIEPTMSLARDPRKCWNIWSENYVQSKAYLLPLSESPAGPVTINVPFSSTLEPGHGRGIYSPGYHPCSALGFTLPAGTPVPIHPHKSPLVPALTRASTPPVRPLLLQSAQVKGFLGVAGVLEPRGPT